jgi:hypothetical protein
MKILNDLRNQGANDVGQERDHKKSEENQNDCWVVMG